MFLISPFFWRDQRARIGTAEIGKPLKRTELGIYIFIAYIGLYNLYVYIQGTRSLGLTFGAEMYNIYI
jgi:hypothetical protein